MSVADLDNYSSPQYGGDKVNLTLTEHELAACHPIRAGGQSWRAFCPFHGSDHQRSMRVNMETGHFNCFACGAWGYTEAARKLWKDQQPKFKNPGSKPASAQPVTGRGNTLPKSKPLPTASASSTASTSAVSSPRPTPAASPHLQLVTYKPPVTAHRQATADLDQLIEKYQAALPGSWGEEYLRRRNIPLDLAVQYGIGYAPPGQWAHAARDWKYGRLVFPHTTLDGRIVNLYGRAVGSNEKVPKQVRHDHLQGEKAYFNGRMLGLEAARPPLKLVDSRETVRPDGQSPEDGPVFICEGPFDALSLLASGRERVVAIFGVNGWRWEWTRSVKELVFALDTDETGQQSWKELARQARLRGKSVGFLPLEAYGGAKDVNEAWISGALGDYFEKIRIDEGKESEEVTSPVVVEPATPVAGGNVAIADIEDPRPDLKRDSWLWETLLHICMENRDRELYGSLHGLRCCGACLEINSGGMLIISRGSELTSEQFGELEEFYFKNRRESLKILLKKLSSKFRPESS